jgi:hypothetical protein
MTEISSAVRSHEQLSRAKVGVPEIVDVPPASFLMIDGRGDPNTSAVYAGAVQALYSAAYQIKFAIKKAGGPAERVAPLEGLWWGAEGLDFAAPTKDMWHWTMMIRLPMVATDLLVANALAAAADRRPELALDQIRIERFVEGLAAQVMHLGPYTGERATIELLHAFIAEQGYQRTGRHHEIYLSDPRRTAPARLRTLIRQPVR